MKVTVINKSRQNRAPFGSAHGTKRKLQPGVLRVAFNGFPDFINCTFPKTYNIEKRVLGIILSLLGIVGLIVAGIKFINGSGASRSIKEVIIYSILGAIFFFAGVTLVKNTKDKPS